MGDMGNTSRSELDELLSGGKRMPEGGNDADRQNRIDELYYRYIYSKDREKEFESRIIDGAYDSASGTQKTRTYGARLDLDAAISEGYSEFNRARMSTAAREAKVREKLDLVNSIMDQYGTDETGMQDINGYDLRFVRVPKENGKTDIRVNGKPAYVHSRLSGDKIARVGGRTEVSMDMVGRAMDHMQASGTTEWEKNLETSGSSVQIMMGLNVGKNVVRVNSSLRGNEAGEVAGGIMMSQDIWDKAYSAMKEYGRSRWMSTRADGDTVECAYSIKLNGNNASLDERKDAPMTNADPRDPSVSREKWDSIYNDMMKRGIKRYAATLSDGTVLEASLIMKVNGREASISRELPPDTIKDVPYVTEISRETWEKAKEQMMNDPRGSCSIPLSDGTRLKGNITIKADGETAYPNIPIGPEGVRPVKDGYVISEDIIRKMEKEMENNRSTSMSVDLPDGKSVSIKKESELELYAERYDGQTQVFKGEALNDAVAKVSGINTDTSVIKDTVRGVGDQVQVQAPRSMVSGMLGVPGKIDRKKMEGEQDVFSALRTFFGFFRQGLSLGK